MIFRNSLRVLAVAAPCLTATTASAETHITQHIAQSTTWDAAGSPYIIDKSGLQVFEGATLTVRGATVLFAADSSNRSIAVFGGLDCEDSLFTSIEDSAPGQWYQVGYRTGSAPGSIERCEFRHGGLGSANANYGALSLSADADVVIVESSFHDNERSGVVAHSGASLEIYDSTFEGNAHGVSVWMSPLTITGSTLSGNRHGLWFAFTDAYEGPRSVVDGNVITGNTGYGITFGTSHVFADGTQNVIQGNGSGPEQIYSFYTWPDADWRGNDFGATFPCVCPFAAGPIMTHTSNSIQCVTENEPPEGGPMSSRLWYLPVDTKTTLYCRTDRLPTVDL